MNEPYTIDVEQPCGESWDKMQPTASGRFCGACQKHVVDFTAFSEKQFIAYFQAYPNEPDLCGRFSEKQFSITIPPKPVPITFWNVNKIAAASLIAALGFTYRADAQVKDTMYTQSIFDNKPDSIFFEKLLVLKGVVQDESGMSIPGVSLSVKGTHYATISDADGRFELELPEQDTCHTLICEGLQYVSREVDIGQSWTTNIALKEDANNRDGNIITMGRTRHKDKYPAYAKSKATRNPNFWQRITKPFRKK